MTLSYMVNVGNRVSRGLRICVAGNGVSVSLGSSAGLAARAGVVILSFAAGRSSAPGPESQLWRLLPSSWVRSVLTSSLDVSAASRVLAVRSLLREVATEVASLLMCDAADSLLLMYDDGEPPVPVREEAASVSSEETADADTMDARRVPFVSVVGTSTDFLPAVGDSSPAASMFLLER